MFHHFKTLSLCCQGIAGEFTNYVDFPISLYVCLMWDIGSTCTTRPVLFSLSLIFILSLQCYCSPLSSIPASYHQYWVPFLKNKEDTMQSIRHERRWTLEYRINHTIKDLYDIYININNIVNSIFPHKIKKLETQTIFLHLGNSDHYVAKLPV